jgi:putative ABC transport system permease protein
VLLTVEGTNLPRPERPIVAMAVTDPGYFQTIGIPLQAGRIFDEADRHRRLVAIVAEALAERVWPGQNPVGQRFRVGPDNAPLVEVVGVVGNVRGVSLTESPTLHVYFPYWQSDDSLYSDQVSLVFKTAANMPAAFSAIRRAIREIDPELPVPAFRTMADTIDESVALRRFQMNLVLLVAAVAVLLACLGIHGVVLHGVAQRTNEIGIRLALGAQTGDVQRLVFTQGGWPVAAGLAAGLIAWVPLNRFLRSLLFGISPTDWLTMWVVAALLGSVAAAAMYVPARRAARVDPLLALRGD